MFYLVLESPVFRFFDPFFKLEHCNKNSLWQLGFVNTKFQGWSSHFSGLRQLDFQALVLFYPANIQLQNFTIWSLSNLHIILKQVSITYWHGTQHDWRGTLSKNYLQIGQSAALELLWSGTTLSTCDAGTAKTKSMDTIGSNDIRGENIPAQETSHSKWKCIPMQNTSDTLNGCLCSMVLHSECNGVLKCKKIGCETQWVSITQINHYK